MLTEARAGDACEPGKVSMDAASSNAARQIHSRRRLSTRALFPPPNGDELMKSSSASCDLGPPARNGAGRKGREECGCLNWALVGSIARPPLLMSGCTCGEDWPGAAVTDQGSLPDPWIGRSGAVRSFVSGLPTTHLLHSRGHDTRKGRAESPSCAAWLLCGAERHFPVIGPGC